MAGVGRMPRECKNRAGHVRRPSPNLFLAKQLRRWLSRPRAGSEAWELCDTPAVPPWVRSYTSAAEASLGNRRRKLVDTPGSLVQEITPPCSSTIRWQMESPSPAFLRLFFVLKNGS